MKKFTLLISHSGCSQCGHTCPQSSLLKAHEKIRAVDKPFSCSQCDHKCTILGHLKIHQKNTNDSKWLWGAILQFWPHLYIRGVPEMIQVHFKSILCPRMRLLDLRFSQQILRQSCRRQTWQQIWRQQPVKVMAKRLLFFSTFDQILCISN